MNAKPQAMITCPKNGCRFVVTPRDFRVARAVVYRGDKTEKRSIRCPNCQTYFNVDVPIGWLEDE